MRTRLYSPVLSGHPTLFLALLLIVLGCLGVAQAAPVSQATQGRLDMSDWDLSQRLSWNLTGDWEFYWGQLLGPEDFAQAQPPTPTAYFPVPGSWIKYRLNGKSLPSDGYATYRLLIDALPDQPLALRVPYMSSAYKLWINGQLIASNGQVGTSRASETPQYKPLVVDVPPGFTQVELVLQISNFHHYRGGMRYPIVIGDKDSIYKFERIELSLIAFLIGCLIFISLYHVLFFALQRKDRSSYYFGIFAFFVVVRLLFVGPILLVRIFPDYNWEIALKIEYITTALLIMICNLRVSHLGTML